MSIPNIHEFKWVEMMNDSKGRTSPTKVIGVLACFTALFTFSLAGIATLLVLWFTNKGSADFTEVLTTLQQVMMQSIALFSLGAGLLGIQRLSSDKEVQTINKEENGNQIS